MSAEVWAILGHNSSAIEKPLHNDCHKSPKSCCSYQHGNILEISTHVPPENRLLEVFTKVNAHFQLP